MICYIYALVDPQIDEAFYVGSSIAPSFRLNNHIHGATNEATHERIQQIMANGYKPEMHILDKVPEELRLKCEKEWIDQLQDKGIILTNIYLVDTPKEELAQITTRIPEEIHRKVKIKATLKGQTITDVIKELLVKWLEEDEQTQADSTQADEGLADVRAEY